MRITLVFLEELAEKIMSMGYSDAEAFPIYLWKNHGWPELNKNEFKIVNSIIKLEKSLKEFNEREA